MPRKMIRNSNERLRDFLGTKVKIEFLKSGIFTRSIEGTLKEIFEDNKIELIDCSTDEKRQIISLNESTNIGLKE